MRLDGKVLIAGAGIGGLTLGCALRRAGIDCEIFEREAELRTVGAGILVQTSAMLALRSLGLDGAVRAAGREVLTGFGTTDQGAVLQRTSMRAVSEALGAPTVAIHRARLQEALLRGLDGVPVRHGSAVQSYEQDADVGPEEALRGPFSPLVDFVHDAVNAVSVGALREIRREEALLEDRPSVVVPESDDHGSFSFSVRRMLAWK